MTLHRPGWRLPSHSGLLSLIVTGRGEQGEEGKEAAEDDRKGQLEIHELD